MKIAVTGMRGQLARCLADRLPRHPTTTIEWLRRPQVDLGHPGTIRSAIRHSRPDVVVNAAAYTAVDQAEDDQVRAELINGIAAGEIAEAAAEIGTPVIQISTDYVFDGASSRAYVETDEVRPLNAYGRSKLAGECRVREANPRHAIVRTAWVYSPFGTNFVKSIIAAAETRNQLSVVADQFGNPTSAFDLADAIYALIDRDIGWGATYHVAGDGDASWFDVAVATMEECGRLALPTARVVPISTSEWPTRAARPRSSRMDSGKFKAAFGFSMPNWRESLREVIARIAQKDA